MREADPPSSALEAHSPGASGEWPGRLCREGLMVTQPVTLLLSTQESEVWYLLALAEQGRNECHA